MRIPGWQSKELSVYRQDNKGLTEIARLGRCCLVEDASRGMRDVFEFEVENPEDILRPDESGTRRLVLEEYHQTQESGMPAIEERATTSVSIDTSDMVTITGDGAPSVLPQAQSVAGRATTDPLSPVEVTTEPGGGGPTWAPVPSESETVTVPGGTVPVGWTVSQAAWSPDREYLAIVTAFGIDTQLSVNRVAQLSIYRAGQGQLRELWREVNTFVTLDEELAFRDVNGDGDPDIVYNTGTGGNGWTSWPTLAASLTADGRAEDLSFRLPIGKSSPTKPVDLDGDGIYEWLAIDASWEIGPFGHADSPSSTFVLAWDGHQYADATERYPQAVDNARLEVLSQSGGSAQLDPQPPPAGASCGEKRLYLRDSVARYLDYFDSRRQDEADRILTALRQYPSFDSLSPARDRVVETLARNPRYLGQPGEFFVCPQ
jgi:hypothetical protein